MLSSLDDRLALSSPLRTEGLWVVIPVRSNVDGKEAGATCILLLSSGGGGGNILRSLKTLFARDVAIAQKSDARFAERLRRANTPRFIDTNEFSLNDVPKEERLLIGAASAQRFGSGHNPLVARQALEESRDEVEALISGTR